MNDLISRQAAIDEANAWLLECLKVNKQDRSCGLIRRLEDLPPAQPKRGKWIEIEAFDDSRYVKCDQCKTVQVFYYGKRNTNFCPNCGCRMDGGE